MPIIGKHESRLIADLVVPAVYRIAIDQIVPVVLHPFALRGGAHDAGLKGDLLNGSALLDDDRIFSIQPSGVRVLVRQRRGFFLVSRGENRMADCKTPANARVCIGAEYVIGEGRRYAFRLFQAGQIRQAHAICVIAVRVGEIIILPDESPGGALILSRRRRSLFSARGRPGQNERADQDSCRCNWVSHDFLLAPSQRWQAITSVELRA